MGTRLKRDGPTWPVRFDSAALPPNARKGSSGSSIGRHSAKLHVWLIGKTIKGMAPRCGEPTGLHPKGAMLIRRQHLKHTTEVGHGYTRLRRARRGLH
jgi:hypothetical protein